MNWKELPQVKKGNIGEKVLHKYLCEMNYTIYNPTTNKSHPFDGLVYSGNNLKFLYDVKTKGKTNIYLEYQKTKLFGEVIILIYHQHKDILSGIKNNPTTLV